MKQFLVLFFLFLSIVPGMADSRSLVSSLLSMREQCEVEPDSFHNYVRRLKAEIALQTDSASKAVYQATLAHLLCVNSGRAQAWDRETMSHPDSTEEWTREEYMLHAVKLYDKALSDKELLHNVPTRSWLPLVSRGKDEKVYGSSMLYVVWNAMKSDVDSRHFTPHIPHLVSLYRKHGLREAEFRLKLDSIYEYSSWITQPEAYRALKDEFRDLPCCDIVYERLSSRMGSDEERRALLQEGLTLYPRSNILRNAILQMESPELTYTFPSVVYPGVEEKTVLGIRNISEVRQTLEGKSDGWRRLAHHQPYERWQDTICWQVPSTGVYHIMVEGKTKAKLTQKPKAEEQVIYSSRLAMFRHNLPGGGMQFVVVDRMSGKPVRNAKVKISKKNAKYQDVVVAELFTGADGKAKCTDLIHQPYSVEVSKDEDAFLPSSTFYYNAADGAYASQEDMIRENLKLYTDRSIYRPGQMVYIGGVAYKQKGHDAEVSKGKDVTLAYHDCNGKKMTEHRLQTDDFGVISDSISLPASAKPGLYHVRYGSNRIYYRVEEYRRPTFYVEMDEAPAVTMPIDTIYLTGKAQSYSGVPLAGARVAGRMSYYNFWGRSPLHGNSDGGPLDTVQTDAEGRFRLAVPLKRIDDRIMYGVRVRVDVDVLSSLGETQQASQTVPLSTQPFMLWADVPERQDKDSLKAWYFNLVTSTNRPVEGDIQCRVIRRDNGKDEVCRFTLPAGKKLVPEQIRELPSGSYDVKAQYVQGTDTAKWEGRFVLFSMNDSHLVEASPVSLYSPDKTFDESHPARVQIGTSLDEAWIYCLMAATDQVLLDTIIHVSDTAFVWNIDYKPEYKDGVSISAAVYNHGEFHSAGSVNLYKALPDKTLTMHWDTFRDKLRPGQQEEWKLSLHHPDGTPASANVLLSMYDASLDAILGHSISLRPSQMQYLPSISFRSMGWYSPSYSLEMEPWMYDVREKEFSCYNNEYFATMQLVGHIGGLTYGAKTGKRMALGAKANDMVFYSVHETAKAAPTAMMKAETAPAAAEEDSAETDMEVDVPSVDVRGRKDGAFTELAFFRPMLRTDKDGVATIAFTLPESLTSWHLMGFAHTRDMFTVGIDDTIVAQKELMAELYLPRFIRTSDKATFTASIRNISDRTQQGKATCLVKDGETEKVIMRYPFQFSLESNADTTFTMSCDASADHTSYIIKWVAEGTDCSDGEQRTLPILSDMEHVTETRAFSLTKPGTTRISLTSLFADNHQSAVRRGMTVEYTTHPMWLAMKSLPSLFVPHCRNVLCQTSAYYATTLAEHILNSVPDTEWLQDSLRYLPLLALDNRMTLLSGIGALQTEDGSFAWFPGMKGNAYMTREVAYLLVRLRMLGITPDAATLASNTILESAIRYLTADARKQVQHLKKEKDAVVGLPTLRYLYILNHCGLALDKQTEKDADFLLNRFVSQDERLLPEDAAIVALVLNGRGRNKEAHQLMEKVEKRLRHQDGCYISYPGGSFTSIDRKLQTHVQIMEAVREVMPEKEDLINGMTEWLLLQKRTQQWDEPSLTANAVYALLQDGTEPLLDRKTDVLKLRDRGAVHTFTTPASQQGYLRDSIGVERPSELVVDKRSGSLSWGAVYADYQMPMDSIRSGWEGFKIRRDVPAQDISVGDRIHVRYTITADRDYDFVSLQLPRPAAAEPVRQVSGYGYQNGLGYYMVVRDSGQEYYIDSMPKGTYVLEEDWLIARKGSYTTGPAVIKCLYAPEYQSHTSGERLEIAQ